MQDEDLRYRLVQLAAKEAVKQVFNMLGVNVDDPEKLEEFRQNLRFGAFMRKVSNRGILYVIGALSISLIAAAGPYLLSFFSVKGGGK